MGAVNGAEHVPLRPQWSCRADGDPWPCEPAREQLRAEIAAAPVTLGYLYAQFLQAVEDLPGVPVGDLIHRFLGWAGQR